MLERLQRFWRGEEPSPPATGADRYQLAAAALLVTAGAMDDVFDDAERARVRILLHERFGLDDDQVEALLAEAETTSRESVDLFHFTSAIKQGFEPDERVGILEMVWEVVYADGKLDDLEASLMRRLAGLLGVTDRDSGDARQKARERLGL